MSPTSSWTPVIDKKLFIVPVISTECPANLFAAGEDQTPFDPLVRSDPELKHHSTRIPAPASLLIALVVCPSKVIVLYYHVFAEDIA